MNWKLIKAFPKFVLVVGVFVISTGLFAFWWISRTPVKPAASPSLPLPPKVETAPDPAIALAEQKRQRAAKIPERIGWLALVGPDLYDIESGELLFRYWLGDTMPEKVSYHKGSNRIIAEHPQAFVRYTLDGTKEEQLWPGSTPAYSNDKKTAIYVKNGDVWMASVDWQEFKYTNERQATHLGQIYAPSFAASIMLQSDKAMILRNLNRSLRIDLLTGDVKPLERPLNYNWRSPDKGMLIANSDAGVMTYNVDTEEAKRLPVPGNGTFDYMWLSNDVCAVLVSGSKIMLYNRKTGGLTDLLKLPSNYSKLIGPSPKGRYVMIMDGRQAKVVDVQEKRLLEFGTMMQNADWISDDTLIGSLDVPDTSMRGTWLKPIGQPERRIIDDPYFFGRMNKGAETVMPQTEMVLFASLTSLFRMQIDSSEIKQIGRLTRPVQRVQVVEIWGMDHH